MKEVQQTTLMRKADARKKIMLGGLFVKAGLDYFYPDSPATLYGMLIRSKQMIEAKPEILDQWKELGKELINS